MPNVQSCEVPAHSFLRKYKDGVGFADCYYIEIQGRVTQEAFIAAFYTSLLFSCVCLTMDYLILLPVERAIVKLGHDVSLARRRSYWTRRKTTSV